VSSSASLPLLRKTYAPVETSIGRVPPLEQGGHSVMCSRTASPTSRISCWPALGSGLNCQR
jgi:hypothetical protein